MDMLAGLRSSRRYVGKKQLACKIIIFIKTINDGYAQSQSRPIRKSFSKGVNQLSARETEGDGGSFRAIEDAIPQYATSLKDASVCGPSRRPLPASPHFV